MNQTHGAKGIMVLCRECGAATDLALPYWARTVGQRKRTKLKECLERRRNASLESGYEESILSQIARPQRRR